MRDDEPDCGSTAGDVAIECPLTEAREHLADLVNRAAYAGETIYLTRRGRRIAALVPVAGTGARPVLGRHCDDTGVLRAATPAAAADGDPSARLGPDA